MHLRLLTAEDVRRALPMRAAIEAMKQAFGLLSAGQAAVPLRSRLDIPAEEATLLLMPAHAPARGGLGVKIVSVFPKNSGRDLPTIHALVLALDPASGRPRALLEGASLTALRTGAASGAATDLLARPDAHVAAIFGSGVQARTQLEAICTVRAVDTVWVYGIDRAQVRAFIDSLAGQGPIPQDLRAARSPQEAVEAAEIICTATTSARPVFEGRAVRPGAHVNAVGSYTPAMQEVDADLVARARVVVDSRAAALKESGDLIVPIRQGLFSEQGIHAELGEIVNGDRPGRSDPSEITLFKSVGIAIQDVLAAAQALKAAELSGLGTTVAL